jgi:hypothetical protein
MSAMSSPVGQTLELRTVQGRPLLARIVRYGDRFGPGGTYENHNGMPVIEFRRADVSARIAYLDSFNAQLFETLPLDVRFSPDRSLANALPIDELTRLVSWLEHEGVIERDDTLV